jgi:ferredoxin
MRVTVDRNKCCGAGSCVRTAPQAFDQNEEDGLVVVLDSEPPQDLLPLVSEAADICPNGVITIEQMEKSSA